MKKHLLFICAFAAGMAATSIIGWKIKDVETAVKKETAAPAANLNNLPILALRKVKIKAGISPDTFEKWATKLPSNEYGKIPGAKFYIAKGERGDDAGTYLFVFEFDSKQTRDSYYPVPGADSSKASAEATRLLRPWNSIVADFGKVGEVVITGKESYTDFIVLQ